MACLLWLWPVLYLGQGRIAERKSSASLGFERPRVSLGQALTTRWVMGQASVESDRVWLGRDCVMPAASGLG